MGNDSTDNGANKSSKASFSSYKWPTMAEEGREMIACSVLMYGFADLRALAREGLLTKGDDAQNARVLNLPISAEDVMEVAEANKEALSSHFSQEAQEIQLSALWALKESTANESTKTQELLVFDDEYSESELVYGIEINHARKRITVGFRGSITVKDFMVDGNASITELPNPLEPPNSGKMIGIHHGFYDYLYGTKKRRDSTGTKCKAEVILENVAALFEKHPDYRLYVTGHSLGGALAVLFAANAAASKDPRIPKPVTVIAVACPKAGNRKFLKAFKTLESQGLIRCLRINNYKDAVTFLPDRGRNLRSFGICEKVIYKHVGIQLVLDKNGEHEFHYPRDEGGRFSRMNKNWTWYCGHDLGIILTMPFMVWYNKHFLLYHSSAEYLKRFEKFAERNGELYLNDVYRQDVPDCDSDFGI